MYVHPQTFYYVMVYLNPIDSLKDAERLSKFLDPFSQGSSAKRNTFCIAKQELLEKQNVKVEKWF
jgi:hypothetical protein